MRKSKRVLKFRKFKVANLQANGVIGGTNSNPCVLTTTIPPGSYEPTVTTDQHSCRTSEQYYPSDCTKGQVISNEDEADCRG